MLDVLRRGLRSSVRRDLVRRQHVPVSRRRGEVQRDPGAVRLNGDLKPLLRVIGKTFVPLMQQNEAGYEAALQTGETRFNEPAFNRGFGLYDGALLGHPFRSVAKSFQVRSWRDLKAAWSSLPAGERQEVEALFGETRCFEET